MLRMILFLCGLTFFASAAAAQSEDIRLKRVFHDVKATFVLYDSITDTTVMYNAPMARERYSPFATFQIWTAAIAAETGVIYDKNKRLPIRWDKREYPAEEHWPSRWKRDHTIDTAFRASAEWYFRELAKRIGETRMAGALQRLGYGNQDISSGVDKFWLNSTLVVSAEEQTALLSRFLQGKTFFSIDTVDFVRGLMIRERGDGYVFSGETGAGPIGPKRWVGWFVGTFENNGQFVVFSTLIEGRRLKDIDNERIELTKEALEALGIWVQQ